MQLADNTARNLIIEMDQRSFVRARALAETRLADYQSSFPAHE